MESFVLPSGAKFDVQPLSYEGSWVVTQSLLKSIEQTELDLKGIDFKQLTGMDVLQFKGPICALLADQRVLDAAKSCFKKCRYNDKAIDSMTFETKDARQDFLHCCFYALKENVAPFFGSLVSSL